jgi:WD40 repeat protein
MEQKQRWEIIRTFDQPGNVRAIDLFKNCNILATSSGDYKSHLLRVDTHKEYESFDNHHQISRAICVNPYYNLLAVGSDDGIVRIINTRDKNETHSFNNKNAISAIKLNHADSQLAVAANHTVRLFDLATTKRLCSIQHQDQPFSVCFSKHDNAVITASLNKVRIFDIRTKEKIESYYRKNRYIASVTTNSDDDIVTVETPGNTIKIYHFTYITQPKEIDTNIPVTVDAGGFTLDRSYNGTPLYSICLQPGSGMLGLGLYNKAVIFAQNNQK